MKQKNPPKESLKTKENLKFIESIKKELSSSEKVSQYFRVEEVKYEILSDPEDYIYGIR